MMQATGTTGTLTRAMHSHESLPNFNPGIYASQHFVKRSEWMELWELRLQSLELDDIVTTLGDYTNVKTLKPLFIIKIGDEAREVYNSKRKEDKSDKLADIIKFITSHYAPKKSPMWILDFLDKSHTDLLF
ncbi:hypothetical protein BpHYR1_050241 [Brachionus plicatilis]|uniref:Uncharacterized protein n=1 Tax=Brachionus plicatilis TaxID=10195 RepID=A0A3M7RJH6_BRAPC|nr:hypothetical protein BpHYR1_050241 [Brachionus plicatilis]